MWTDQDREKYKADGRRYPSDLTDAEWNVIKPLFQDYFTFTADLREMVNACFYLEHTGCPWRSLPINFGAWQTVRPVPDRRCVGGCRRPADATGAKSSRPLDGAGDRDHGFAKRRLRPSTR